jgi:hypothetical protein
MLKDDLLASGTAFLPLVTIDSLISDSRISTAALKRIAQNTVTKADDIFCLHHLQSLEVQGECFHLDNIKYRNIWDSAMHSLPDIIFKFALNSTLDTLEPL